MRHSRCSFQRTLTRKFARTLVACAIGFVTTASLAPGQAGRPPGAGGIRPPVGRPQKPTAPTTTFRPDEVMTDEELNAEIVARVDDQVILLAQILPPVRPMLEQAKKQLPPEEYQKYEWQTLQKMTNALIERQVVLNEIKLRIPDPSILGNLRSQIEQDFEKHLDRMVQQNGFKDRESLLEQLRKEGVPLSRLRSDFTDRTLAEQFLNQLVRPEVKEPTRDDLLRYYREHAADFTEQAGVIWSHIQVGYGTDKEAAQKKAKEAHEKLLSGTNFADVARQFSDGPTAIDGGAWSLTSQGSYADKAVDASLFSIPVGEISTPIEGANAFHIVRVEKRNDGTPVPFAEVQGKLKNVLKNEGVNELRAAKLQEIMKHHYVESIFNEDQTELSLTADKSKLVR